jgi:hypothetical protein
LLLWLLSASASAAAEPLRASAVTSGNGRGHTLTLRTLVRQLKALGSPLARHGRRLRAARAARITHIRYASPTASHDDNDAIQNDAPAAQSAADPIAAPQAVATVVDALEQRPPFAPACFPRSPRGPPASA